MSFTEHEAQKTPCREVWFGGTFDPVHHGHLISALALASQLDLDRVNLTPCNVSPLKSSPACTAEQRLSLLRLCAEQCKVLEVDERELARQGPSRTVDTLEEIRRELGPDAPLMWVVGWDAFLSLPLWHRWQSLFDLGNVIVINRPGYSSPTPVELKAFCQGREVIAEELFNFNFGKIVFLNTPKIDIASSVVRQKISRAESIQYLVPDVVAQYIKENQLYVSSHRLGAAISNNL